MFKPLSSCVVALMLLPFCVKAADKFNPADFKEITYDSLRSSPEDYKNKKVVFDAKFLSFTSDFPKFLEHMGFKDDKYFRIKTPNPVMTGNPIAIFVKKSEQTKAEIPTIKAKSLVKFYGKVKKFTAQPAGWEAAFPDYYVEVENLEIVEEGAGKGVKDDTEKGVAAAVKGEDSKDSKSGKKDAFNEGKVKPPKEF